MSRPEKPISVKVCKDSDVKENEMKIFKFTNNADVLMVRQKGKLHALGARCTHYDAPLVEGALGEGCVRCPWHGARFALETGDIEDYPGLDSLPSCAVSIKPNKDVYVSAKVSELQSSRREVFKSPRDFHNMTTFVIIGGGPSALICAETLRQNDFVGKIIMITQENALPYDRVLVSKYFDATVPGIQLRDQAFFDKNGIEVIQGRKVVNVNADLRRVYMDNSQSVCFNSLYIATGVRSRPLQNVPGSDLGNIFTLRTFQDSNKIQKELGSNKSKKVMILGSSFIGMEAAAYCSDKSKSVTVIGRGDVPFKNILGTVIGRSYMKLFKQHGVLFEMNKTIKKCNGINGKIVSLELSDGSMHSVDILILGIGSLFNTEFLKGCRIQLDDDGSIPINEKMETNVENIFAGGDVAKAPVYGHGVRAAIGHYGLAQYHGRIAARNMLHNTTPLTAVPFFWTRSFERSILYCGFGRFSNLSIKGNTDQMKFVARYFDGNNKVIAMASCQWDEPEVPKFAELIKQGKELYGDDPVDLL